MERLHAAHQVLVDANASDNVLNRAENTVQLAQDKQDALESLSSKLNTLEPPVRDRVARAVRQHFKDLLSKVETGVKRELDRLVSICVDEVTPVLNGVDPDLDATVQSLQTDLEDMCAGELPGILEGLEAALAQYQDSLSARAGELYSEMTTLAGSTASKAIKRYLDQCASNLEAAAGPTSSASEPPSAAGSPVRRPTTTSITNADQPTPPPLDTKPTPPRPPPRNLPSTQAPRPFSMPDPNTGSSEALNPPSVPSRPRPFSVADNNNKIDTSKNAAEAHQDSPLSPSSQVKNVNLMSDLNRLLAGPPKAMHRSVAKEPEGLQEGIPEETASTNASHEELEQKSPAVSGEGADAPPMSPVHADISSKKEEADDLQVSMEVSDEVTNLSSTLVLPVSKTPISPPNPPESQPPHPSPPVVPPSPAAKATVAVPPPTAPPAQKEEKHAGEKHEKKKGGFMGMLNSLTKSRPKAPRRKDTEDSVDANKSANEMANTKSEEQLNTTEEPEASAPEPSAPPPPVVPRPTPPSLPDKPNRTSTHIKEEEQNPQEDSTEPEPVSSPPRPVPRPPAIETPSTPTDPTAPESPSRPPRPVPVPLRPTSAAVSEPVSEPDPESASASIPIRPPKPVPVGPRPVSSAHSETGEGGRPMSMSEEQIAGQEGASESNGEEPPPRPKKIPGLFANQAGHHAMAAMAAAMAGRAGMAPPRPAKPAGIAVEGSHGGSQEEGLGSSTGQHHAETEGEEEHGSQSHLEARPAATPSYHSPLVLSPSQPLSLKKKENSVSGDDKAIEKHALDWLNLHLQSKEIHVDNLYTCLGDGLNLIYALEACTGETVGKYNKRAMMSVHRIDNIAVALNFLSKKGISTQFCSPQDIMDGDKSKILTLFNYILKKF
ncbi:hypothetical protein HDV05_001864 [Chytridiales sp. JEL 0842]|nr:hypothetical protein HDV05_001864 [Chytridiales sp. JEL 0842]